MATILSLPFLPLTPLSAGKTGFGHVLEGPNRVLRETQVAYRCSAHADAQDGELPTPSPSSLLISSSVVLFLLSISLMLSLIFVDIWLFFVNISAMSSISLNASILPFS